MNRFIVRLLFFACPWMIYATTMVVIDPYNRFNVSNSIPGKVKLLTSAKLDPALWKLEQFERSPCSNILLGDSRIERLSVTEIRAVEGLNYCNMGLPGASVKEIIDAFWFMDSRTTLQNVVIGINFNIYNANYNRDRIVFVRAIQHNPFLYLANTGVSKAAAYNLYYAFSGADPALGVPAMSRDAFWEQQLGPMTDQFYTSYSYPVEYRAGLTQIAEHCRRKGINLTFVVLPSHVDLQERVSAFGLQPEYANFKRDLAAIARTIDFDFPSAITRDRAKYKDPYHFNDEVSNLIVRDLWSDQLKYGKVLQ